MSAVRAAAPALGKFSAILGHGALQWPLPPGLRAAWFGDDDGAEGGKEARAFAGHRTWTFFCSSKNLAPSVCDRWH